MKRVRVLILRFLAVAVLAAGVVIVDQRAQTRGAAPGPATQSPASPAPDPPDFGQLK